MKGTADNDASTKKRKSMFVMAVWKKVKNSWSMKDVRPLDEIEAKHKRKEEQRDYVASRPGGYTDVRLVSDWGKESSNRCPSCSALKK